MRPAISRTPYHCTGGNNNPYGVTSGCLPLSFACSFFWILTSAFLDNQTQLAMRMRGVIRILDAVVQRWAAEAQFPKSVSCPYVSEPLLSRLVRLAVELLVLLVTKCAPNTAAVARTKVVPMLIREAVPSRVRLFAATCALFEAMAAQPKVGQSARAQLKARAGTSSAS